jgi:RHS repeat-associated protein
MVWALADRLGSIETLTDGEGVVVDKRTYDSFGRVLSETNPSVSFRYGYTGRELDLESGLNYYRARYYDPNVGRFISVDPMGFGAGDTNLYRYVGNSATNATDPTGEWINFVAGGFIGAGLDLGIQLLQNGGKLSDVHWDQVAISGIAGAVGGGIGGALGKGGALLRGTALAETGLGLGARTAINAGVGFNTGYYGKVAENAWNHQYLTDGALATGIFGGVGAGAGELVQAGAGAVWKSKGVQNALTKATSVAENISIFARNRVTDARIILDPKIRFSDNISSYELSDLRAIREEAVNLSRSDSNIGKSYTERIASGEKTIAYADIEINGSNYPTLGSVSGGKDFGERVLRSRVGDNYAVPDYAKNLTSDSNLKAYKVNSKHGERSTDSEIKILEHVLQMTTDTPDVTGKIRMVLDKNSCYSCQKVALDFRELRPGIELEFVYQSNSKPLNAIYNKLRNSF